MVSLRRRRLLGLASGPLPLYCENLPSSRRSPPNDKPRIEDPKPSDDTLSDHDTSGSGGLSSGKDKGKTVAQPSQKLPSHGPSSSMGESLPEMACSNKAIPGSTSATCTSDGRMWIWPHEVNYFIPLRPTMKIISSICKASYEGAWSNFSQVPRNVKTQWWDEFKKKCIWDSQDEKSIYKIWRKKCSSGILSMFKDVSARKRKAASLEQNRNNLFMDKGRYYHRGGFVTVSEHKRKLTQFEELRKQGQASGVSVDDTFLVGNKAGCTGSPQKELVDQMAVPHEVVSDQPQELETKLASPENLPQLTVNCSASTTAGLATTSGHAGAAAIPTPSDTAATLPVVTATTTANYEA